MIELELINLDNRAHAFVLEHLAGVNTFCSALASRVGATKGRVFTVAPAGTPEERLYRFAEGGLLAQNRDEGRRVKVDDGWMMPVVSLKNEQARLIVEMIRDHLSRSCVVDDFDPVWSDIRRDYDLGATAFGIGEEVYHWFDGRHDAEVVESTIRQTDTIWHGVAAVCECAAPSPKEPTLEWLVASGQSAIAIFCSAYDGEGFVGWRSAEEQSE